MERRIYPLLEFYSSLFLFFIDLLLLWRFLLILGNARRGILWIWTILLFRIVDRKNLVARGFTFVALAGGDAFSVCALLEGTRCLALPKNGVDAFSVCWYWIRSTLPLLLRLAPKAPLARIIFNFSLYLELFYCILQIPKLSFWYLSSIVYGVLGG